MILKFMSSSIRRFTSEEAKYIFMNGNITGNIRKMDILSVCAKPWWDRRTEQNRFYCWNQHPKIPQNVSLTPDGKGSFSLLWQLDTCSKFNMVWFFKYNIRMCYRLTQDFILKPWLSLLVRFHRHQMFGLYTKYWWHNVISSLAETLRSI